MSRPGVGERDESGAMHVAALAPMPQIVLPASELAPFGVAWRANGESLSRSSPYSSSDLTKVLDRAVGEALAALLGGIPVVSPARGSLVPAAPDCVEVGPVRVVGGVRPQDFDVGYRPDGIRFAFDSKTLNDHDSVAKNWQNMVNDLATEATTVHSRFPQAVVAFLVMCPAPSVPAQRRRAMIETLERLSRRSGVDAPPYLAEAIAFVLWNPASGSIDASAPASSSPLRLEAFSKQVEAAYVSRYKGLPPHAE